MSLCCYEPIYIDLTELEQVSVFLGSCVMVTDKAISAYELVGLKCAGKDSVLGIQWENFSNGMVYSERIQ